jgi:hypothetical protein
VRPDSHLADVELTHCKGMDLHKVTLPVFVLEVGCVTITNVYADGV